jgi:Acetylornithine deacetylase/Succinyl-diaminopimelate desuccinylase and related deacylases
MDRYTPYLEWIDEQHEAMVRLLLDWSAINSGSYNLVGLNTMRQALMEKFGPLGTHMEEISLVPMEVVDSAGEIVRIPLGKALRITHRPTAKHQVFLGGHMDTVFEADHPFQKTTWRDANCLKGPGVADLKGGLVVMLKALEALERSPYAGAIGWEVLINPDEELGSPGSAPLLEESAQCPHFGLLYEPTLPDGTLAGARKGSGNFTVVIRGISAHAGREPHTGRNAIVALARFILAVNALNGQRPGVTVNLGKIEGGGPINIVPDLAICHFNIRIGSAEEQTWVETELKRLCQIQERHGITLRLQGGFHRPPKVLDPVTLKLFRMIAACGGELHLPVKWQSTGGCCDGNNLAAAGLPTVDTLGVRGGNLHTSEEFVLLDSLCERVRLSALFLMKLGAGELDMLEGP